MEDKIPQPFNEIRTDLLSNNKFLLKYHPRESRQNLVSVCIPIYNSIGTLHRLINSLENQSYSNIEVVVSDGLSTDGSLQTLLDSTRIDILYSNYDGSAEIAANRAIALSSGEFICIVAADDWLDQDLIKKCINQLCNHKLDLVFPSLAIVSGSTIKKMRQTKFNDQKFNYKMPNVPGISWIIRRSSLEMVGLIDERVKIASDFDFILRCLNQNLKIGYVNDVFYYHSYGGNSTVSPLMTYFDTALVARKNGGNVFYSYILLFWWCFKYYIKKILSFIPYFEYRLRAVTERKFIQGPSD